MSAHLDSNVEEFYLMRKRPVEAVWVDKMEPLQEGKTAHPALGSVVQPSNTD